MPEATLLSVGTIFRENLIAFPIEYHDITIRPCAEGNALEAYGADCSGCMTVRTFETALQESWIDHQMIFSIF